MPIAVVVVVNIGALGAFGWLVYDAWTGEDRGPPHKFQILYVGIMVVGLFNFGINWLLHQ